jgi:aspartyl-tRNA(Asn)/glutamyl-tRNA(Gln) amidotransferase subunit A
MSDFSSDQEQLKNGKSTLPDLVDSYLERIEKENPRINAFVSVDGDTARKEAKRIQKKIEDGSAGKMAGAVVGVKDVICEKGKVTSCASNILRDFESVYDATVIEKLRREDALFIGRLNMDEFAMGSSNENTIYGTVHNPHNPDKVAGGSSGGSAAAVAGNLCNLALGSDTGGSIRQPASYCGVVGLKPTYSRVSRYGLVAYASSFDCIGPLSANVRDAAEMLGVIAGFDPNDNTSSTSDVPDFTSELENDEKLKVGVPDEYFGEGLDDEVRQVIEDQLSQLETDKRFDLVPIKIPHLKYSIATYYILATAEASSNLARFDGVRYGHRGDINEVRKELALEKEAIEERIKHANAAEKNELIEQLSGTDSALIRLYKKSRTEGFGKEVKRRIILGTYVLSAGYYDAYYAKAQKVRRLIKEDFDKAFSKVDVIVSPTAPTTAFDIGSNIDNPVQMYLNDIYTTSANLAGICGISVPAGNHSNGMPVGIQFMGDKFRESEILRAGYLIEKLNQ